MFYNRRGNPAVLFLGLRGGGNKDHASVGLSLLFGRTALFIS